MKKATSIDEIYSVFAHEKSLKKEDKDLYVNLYEKDLKRFVNALIKNQIPTKTFYIAGQSGNGKSTILNLLTTKYPELENKYEFFYISGKTIFDYEDVNIVDILLMIANQLVQNCKNIENSYIEKLRKFQDISNGTLEISESESSTQSEEIKANASLKVGANFFNMLKVGMDFLSSYRLNDTARKDARRVFKIYKKELIDFVNEIILDYKTEKNLGKELLIVIDDLEKKENTDKLFLEDLRSLDEINLVKIVTMPIHLKRTQTFLEKEVREFALKLNHFDDKPNEEDKKLLIKVVESRIENLSLIDKDVIELAVEKSGANLRQLMKLIHFAAEEASTFESRKITMKELEYSIEFLQKELSSPVIMLKSFLKEILEHKMPKEEDINSLENLGKATKMGLAFAYFNGKTWYEVNPLITDVLISYTKKDD